MKLTESSGSLLPVLNKAMPHRLVPVLREFLHARAGAVDTSVLLADYELRELRALSPRPGEQPAVPVEGSPAGACFTGQVVVTQSALGPDSHDGSHTDREVTDGTRPGSDPGPGEAARDGIVVLVPLSLRAERLGVLRVVFNEPVQAELLRGLAEVALTVSYVLVACGSCSDVVEIARRARPLSVAAEMQWNLQPLRAFSTEQFSVAGQLIPAYEVGGDCYDYNVAAGHLDLSSLDAMGHGVRASLLAGLATAVMRNARRAGQDPVGQVMAADQQLLEQFGGAQFVTAVAMRLDLTDGLLQIVNAGHPAPWLVREGQAVPVELDPQLPAGMFETTGYRSQQLQLKAGDRLVLVTDGVLEAGAPEPEFGADRLAGLLLATTALSPHRCVTEVLHTVRSYAPRMHDDATVICLDWHPTAHPA